ncbi:hypothetical protein Pmani_012305 [Petrolisthes manimaculis]|uniref:Protein-tyrosine-phosphatase n=1 Tax=Petrolisthes manimaculis TaxID=1843537 RepID=A0AAE1PXB1_9EUCA|nr:hypothetical protein Pmani_012305 [Petrolisthes manimaculis]
MLQKRYKTVYPGISSKQHVSFIFVVIEFCFLCRGHPFNVTVPVTMWGRTLWFAVISCVVYQQLGCQAESRIGMEEYRDDGGGGDMHSSPPHLSDDNALNSSEVNQTLHSQPARSTRVKRQASYPIPDINILYKFKRNSRAPDELSCITGDPNLTLQTEILPSLSKSLSFYDIAGGKTSTWDLTQSLTQGVVCKADNTDLYSASAPILPSGAYYVPRALSVTINKGQDLKVELEAVTGGQDVWWNIITKGRIDRMKVQINNNQLTIPYHQLNGSGFYQIWEYSTVPDAAVDMKTVGIISLLVRECPEGKYGPPDCHHWCKDCMYGGVCHDRTGECICPAGLTGSYCQSRCPDGYIGRDCNVQLVDVGVTAVCLSHPLGCHCAPGYKGYKCSDPCQSYEWGIDCSQRCSGYCQYNCDDVTGKCNTQTTRVCEHGDRGLPRLRKPPIVSNTTSGNILVQFTEWDHSYDDGEVLQGDSLSYRLRYWPVSDTSAGTWLTVTPPSKELTNLTPVTQYGVKVVVLVTRSSEYCVEYGSAKGRVHTEFFNTSCPASLPQPTNIRTMNVESDGATIHWDSLEYVDVCDFEYRITISPANGGQELVNDLTRLTSKIVDGKLSPNTEYTVHVRVVRKSSPWDTRDNSNVGTINFITKPPKPVINLRTTASHVFFSVQAPPGASNNLQYSYRYKINRTACASRTYRPGFTDWSQWYDTPPTVVTPIEKLAYSTVTYSVIAQNSAGVGPEAEKSVDVGTAVPLLAVEFLICEEHQPTSCSVRLETNCYKENGPGITVSYDLVNDGKKKVYGTWTSAPPSLVLPNNELPPYTWITIRAYPANNAGRNTDSSLMKEDHFRTAPGKPGQVSNVNTYEASTSITVSWEKPLDNPIPGELEGYKVKWKSINSRSWEEERIHNSNTLSYTITGLTNHEEYEIRVSAKNKDVDEYGDDVTTFATTTLQKGKPSLVKDLMVVNVTQTTATVVWNEPDDSQGTIENYIVSLVKEPQGNISRNITERIYEFTNLQEGGKYIAGVKICNKKFCSYPVNKEFYTRPALPQVDGEPGLMYSDSTSVTVRLPVLHNLPGYQWIVLKIISAGEDSDVVNNEFKELLKQAAVDFVNETLVQRSSSQNKRFVENPKEMRIAARLSQREGNLTKKFTVGDNKMYDNYENEPLEEGSTYWMVVVTVRKFGPHYAFKASPPIAIKAVPYTPISSLVVTLVCLLLLMLLLFVLVLARLFYERQRAKLRTGGTGNNLVTYTDGNENPRVNIEDLNRQEEELYLTPLTPSNPGSYPSVRVAEVEEVPEELSHREKVLGVEEEENEDDGTYYYVCRRIFEDGLESYLSRAMFVLETDQEFKKIPYIMSKSCSDGEEAVNSKKNRYKNNLPYNDTRVKLPLVNNKLGSDYINACYVKSTGNPKAFIATQTPMDNEMDTIGDFWRMIWHTKCNTIVKGVNLTENGEVNDAKYWPNIDEQMVKYDITIQLLSEEVKLGFHVRVFKVTRRDEAREIVQYHYPNWTDYGVAYNPFGLAQMLKLIRSTTPVGPITVHCSNGIGWTGMVILVLYVLEELEAMKYTSPAKALGVIRTGRPRLVEKMEQYRFGHSLLLEILFGVKTSIISSSYVMELSQLRASNLINNQYTKLKTLPKDLSFKFAEKPVFANLNRNPNILPGELVDMVVECEIHVYVMVVVESVRVDVMVVEGVRVYVMVVVEGVRVYVMVVVVGVRVYVMVVVEGVRVDVMVVVGVRVDVMVVVVGVRVDVMVVVEGVRVYVMVVVEGVRVDVMVVVVGVRVDVMVVVEGVRVDVMVVAGVRVDVMVVEGVRVYVMVVVEGVRVDVMVVVVGVRVDVMVVVVGVRVDVMVVVEGVRVDVMVVVVGVRVDVMVVEGVTVDVMVVVEGVRVDVMVVERVRVDVMVVVEGVRVDVMVVVEGVRVDVMVVVEGDRVDVMVVVEGVRVDVMVVVEGVRVDVMVVEGVRVDVMVVVEGVRVDVMVVVVGVRVDVMVVEGVRVDVMVVVEGVRVDVMVVEGVRVDVMVVEGVRVDVMVVVEGVRVDVMVVVVGVRVDVMVVVVGVRVDVMVVVEGVRVDVMVVEGVRVDVMVVEGVRVDVMVVVEGVRVDVMVVEGVRVDVMVVEGVRVDVMVVVEGVRVDVMVVEGVRVDVMVVEGVRVDVMVVVEGVRVDVMVVVEGVRVYVMVVVEGVRVDVMVVEGVRVDVMVVEGVRVDVMVVEGVRVYVMVVVEGVRVYVMVVVVGVRVYVMVVVEGVRVDVMVVVGVRVDVMVVVVGVRVDVMVVVEGVRVYVMVVVEGVRVDVMVVVVGVRVDVMVVVEGVRVDVMVVVEGVRVDVMVVEGVRVDVMVVEGVRVYVMVVVEGVRVDVMVVVEGVRVDVIVVEGVRVDVMVVVEGVRVDVMVVVEGDRVDVMVVEGDRVDVMVVEGVRVDVMVVVEGVRVDVMVVEGVRVYVMVVVGVRVDVMVVEGVRVDVMVVVEGVRVDVMVVVEGVRVYVMVVVEGVRVDVMVVVVGVRVDVMVVVEGVRVDVMVVEGVRVDVMVVVEGVRGDVIVVEGVSVDVMVVEGDRVDVIHVDVMVVEGDRVDVIHVDVMVVEGDRVDVIHVYVMVVEGDRVDVIHVDVMVVVEGDRVDVIHVDVMVVEVDSRLVFLRGVLGNIASQYINVIKINGLDCRDAYLAGEHPQEHTVEAAWRLVMEHQVSVWVHLHTFPHPNPEYPEIVSGEGTMDIGMMRLIVGPPSSFRNFTEYTVDIIPTTTTSSIATPHHRMVVLQLHGWSHTQSLPEQPDALLAVLEKAESLRIINQQMLFTCKDGVTGCGVAAALLLARERIKLIQEVDVYRSVLSVLFDRPEFITCVEQYNFLYTAMEKFITGNKLYGNFA